MAGGSSSRPDTLKQTGSAANLDKPLADGAGHTFYEDRSARISIMAGGSSSRPDTLKQTGSAANLDKPLADGAGHTFLKLPPKFCRRRPVPRPHRRLAQEGRGAEGRSPR